MFSRNSPLKRRHNEYHDPDYPQPENHAEEDDGKPGCSKNFANKRRKSVDGFLIEKEIQNENYVHKVRQVIEREFQQEILMKQQQLEEIDQRLEKAKHLLERLRYKIVLEYYKKQEIPLTSADAAAIRGPNCLFEREDKGPQMPLHPSLKKLIGKRPKDLSDVIRICPRRTAAKNAVQTIREKSQVQKREEKKLRRIIRDQGIVIDHSKQNSTENDVNTLLNAAAQNALNSTLDLSSTVKQEKIIKKSPNKQSGKSLNASRLNNKMKHLIVVGNTSKYIGNEVEREAKSHTKNLTFKWLVYVQIKEAKQPIERFIKKVRFYLHQSYRPNDVVDIESPPFQISRRGWGEFPIRVQLFFHSELHQKPVQLIHNIILDKTLSGMQTLGSETLLEIWLRDVKWTNTVNKEIKNTKPEIETVEKTENHTVLKTEILTRSEELVDENLLDFLNKIEASPCSISADIEKIQPTVVVNGPLGVKIKTPSPEKRKLLTPTHQESPTKITSLEGTLKIPENTTPNITSNSIVSVPQITTSVPASGQFKTPIFTNNSLSSKPITTFIKLPSTSTEAKSCNLSTTATSNVSQIPPLRPITPIQVHTLNPNQSLPLKIQKPPIILNKDGKILMPSSSVASAVRKTILPILNSVPTNVTTTTSQALQLSSTNAPQIASVPTSSTSMALNAPKQILQKKLVQLIDSTGKVKYIQMLVATSSSSTSAQNLFNSYVAPKLVTMAPSIAKNKTVTNTTQITKTVSTPSLKLSNGLNLAPALTIKPNIFKIVPESMQTKPQILTFNTISTPTANTNTITTVNTQQPLKRIFPTTSQIVEQIAASSGVTTAKPNTVTVPVANKLAKTSSNNTTTNPPKNLVYQKEGKLCVIDPQQIKYKQQQRKQESLLKPQISLLKQQQRKMITPATTDNSITDANKSITATQLSNKNVNVPQIHFGLKQQRINSINNLQLMQMKRMLFEKQFLRQEFTSMRTAVEFLLRRLKLVVSKESFVSDFPFVSHTLQEFQSLTAFKQRACEWLRAKNISRLLRNHKDLQRLNNTSKDLFWSTKEIAIFARQYAYTPPIKSLPRPGDQQQTAENNSKGFSDLVKSELKQEHNLQYDTLTDHCKVGKWIDKVWHTLEDYEHYVDEHQIIDIDGIDEEEANSEQRKNRIISNAACCHIPNSPLDIYLAPPPHLENQCQLVYDICKDFNIKLSHEEIDTNIYHPSTQTVLAQCLYLFIEKVLRQAVAFKQRKSSVPLSGITSVCTLLPQDFANVLDSSSEFDFLTNNNFGSAVLAECTESSIKLEEP